VEAWIESLVSWYSSELKTEPEIHIACYEAFLAAARNARHRPIIAEWFDTWRQSAELALKAAGSSDPRGHADLFVAALIGVVLQQLAAPRRGFRREAKVALLELVDRLTART
jgi:TetR/AcrR family transcriptional regulator, regulator of biofilm formation and stress response